MKKFALLLDFNAVAHFDGESIESVDETVKRIISTHRVAREYVGKKTVYWAEMVGGESIYVVDDINRFYDPLTGETSRPSKNPESITINANKLSDDSELLAKFPRNLPTLQEFFDKIEADYHAEERRKLEEEKAALEREKDIGRAMTMKDIEEALGYKFHIVG